MKNLREIIHFGRELNQYQDLLSRETACQLFKIKDKKKSKGLPKLVLAIYLMTGVHRLNPTSGVCYDFLVDVSSLAAFKESKHIIFNDLNSFESHGDLNKYEYIADVDIADIEGILSTLDGKVHLSHYLKSLTKSNLYKKADSDYSANHENYSDFNYIQRSCKNCSQDV